MVEGGARATPSESRNAATYIAVTTTYAGPMPIIATPPAPAIAPNTRAVSDVVRVSATARSRTPGGMVWPTSAWRITMSEGRSRPASVAMVKTCHGSSCSVSVSAASAAARTA